MAKNTAFTVHVKGLKEFQALVAESETMLESELAAGILAIANEVARDTRSRYSEFSIPGAAGVKAKLSGGQVWTGSAMVVQTLRKSRDVRRNRPNFGGLMMRKAFLPALRDNQARVDELATGLLAELQTRWETEGEL